MPASKRRKNELTACVSQDNQVTAHINTSDFALPMVCYSQHVAQSTKQHAANFGHAANVCVRACVCVCVCVRARVCVFLQAYMYDIFFKRLVVSTHYISRRKVTALLVLYIWLQLLCAVPVAVHHPCRSDNPCAAMYPRTIIVWPSCMPHNFTHCLDVQEMGEYAAELQQAEAMPEHTCSSNSSGEICVQQQS